AYNRWANHRILDAAAKLDAEALDRDLGSSSPSVRATLAHTLAAEWAWLSRWKGTSPTGLPDSWEPVHARRHPRALGGSRARAAGVHRRAGRGRPASRRVVPRHPGPAVHEHHGAD